jgi:flagellar hook-length control protein FliK
VPGLPASFGVAAFFRSRTAAPAVVPIRADAVADASAEARIDASAAGSATLNKDAARQTADAGPGPGPLPRSTESPLPAPAHPSSPASHGSDTHAAPRLTPGNEPARSGSSAAAEQAAPAGPLPAAALPAPPDPVTGQGTHAAKTNLLAAPIAMNDADPAASEPAAEQETPVQLWGGLVVRAPVAHAPLEPATPAQRPEDRKGSSGDTSGNMDAIDNSGPVLHSTADPVGEPSAPHARDAAPAPPVSDQLAGEIMARAQWSSHNGQTEFRVRLDPPELGTVRVHLTVNDQTITAKVVVASDATRQLIESQVDHLRQTLADAGVSLGRFDVSRDGGGAWHGTGHPQQPEPIPNYGPPAMSRPVAATAWQPASRASLGGIDVLI